MKKLTVKKDVSCMACLECVRACSTTFYKEFNEDYSCIRIVAKGDGAKPNVCIQCGKCAKAGVMIKDSPTSAMTAPRRTGTRNLRLSLNSFSKCVRQWISLS